MKKLLQHYKTNLMKCGGKMEKVELVNDISVYGVGAIKKGTQFKVDVFNSKYVYVTYLDCTLQISRKDIKVIY